jgi:catechol 2,3-dioxygenase-like lactoylglutathione lyase family enzyme
MLETSEAVGFLPSQDLELSARFFTGVLGLQVVSRSPFATVFRVGDATLRVTKVDELRPQPFTVFGWLVPDLRTVIRELHDRDTEVLRYDGMGQDDDGVWTTPGGDLVAWFHDPDANVLSLTKLVHG